ncbi:MAG: DUF72 domain-containing protein [Bacteroidota bacterium]
MKWSVGCSGFYNKHWKGIFYPEDLPQSKWLNFYCEYFNTLELNVTFYQFPTEERMRIWFKKSSEDFLFSVKAPRLITHYKKFNDCEKLLNDFYQACEKGLKNKLGCILFQLPPSIQYSQEQLDQIISALHPGFKNVIEFRHSSWWDESIYKILAEKEIIFCSINHQKFPTDIITTAPIVYVRLHGNPELYYSGYKSKELNDLHMTIKNDKKIKETYVYFNNTAGDAGIMNAMEFNKIVIKK